MGKSSENNPRALMPRTPTLDLSDNVECGGLPQLSPPWPHAPVHVLTETGVFMVTSGTYQKQHFFPDGPALRLLHDTLLQVAFHHKWALEAWAVFPNHYHFIAQAPENAHTLVDMLRELHSRTAIEINRGEGTAGRKVWHNYWDTRLTYQASYLARLHYVHQNPAKHGLTDDATKYPWCSAAWFERTATPAQVKTIYSIKTDKLRVRDDF